jgi:hypothetical protein
MLINRRTLIAAGLAFALLATPAAAQPGQDLRSPDTRDAATVSGDLRSPDVRDVANRYAPRPSAVTTPQAATIAVTGTGTDWTTTGLAAGGYLLAVVAVGFALRVRSRGRVTA